MKKLTVEFIRKQFKKENYTLLSTEYINSKQKLGYTCPNGHKHSIRWDNWQSGKRCPYCSWEKTAQKRRKDIKEIRQAFKDEGYTLLTTKYKNSKQKLEYICPVGHRHQIAWEKWQAGVRCFYCFGTPKKTLKEVRETFKKEGFTLLSKNYIGAQQKLDYICPAGHYHSMNWNNWRQGNRCPYCSGNARKTFEEVKKSFEQEGYTLLSTKYKNSETKLDYICPKGHKRSIKWGHWIRGHRCPTCMGHEKKTIEEIQKELANEGYTLLSKIYVHAHRKLEYICPKGHRAKFTWADWQNGHRCQECYHLSQAKMYSPEELQKLQFYRSCIQHLSNQNFYKYFYLINPQKLPRGNDYHLDHKYSVMDGFENNVAPEIISSPVNLQMLTAHENQSKNRESVISLEKLHSIHKEWENYHLGKRTQKSRNSN